MPKFEVRACSPTPNSTRGRMMGRAEIIAAIKEYGDENMRMAQDTILLDPVLSKRNRGKMDFGDAVDMSEKLIIDGTIHSSKYHAAKEILKLIGVDYD